MKALLLLVALSACICSTSLAAACPPGVPTVNCLVAPCAVTLCAAGTVCENNYCGGCNAVCRPINDTPAPGMPNNMPSVCPNGKPPPQCPTRPCSVARCIAGTTCKDVYCPTKPDILGCTAVCEPNSKSSPQPPLPQASPKAAGNGSGGQCPPGVPVVNCLVAPCMTAKCSPGHVCEDNYCGGCNAVCRPVGSPSPAPTAPMGMPSVCPNGKPPPKCTTRPCMVARCMAGTTCKDVYCPTKPGINSCTAVCVPNRKSSPPPLPLSPKPSPSPVTASNNSSSQCQPGVPVVKCAVAPCTFTLCPTNTRCVNDYCGKCSARCVPLDGNEGSGDSEPSVNSTSVSPSPADPKHPALLPVFTPTGGATLQLVDASSLLAQPQCMAKHAALLSCFNETGAILSTGRRSNKQSELLLLEPRLGPKRALYKDCWMEVVRQGYAMEGLVLRDAGGLLNGTLWLQSLLLEATPIKYGAVVVARRGGIHVTVFDRPQDGRLEPKNLGRCTMHFKVDHGSVLGVQGSTEGPACQDGFQAVPLGKGKGTACVPCELGTYSTGGKACQQCVKPGYAGARGSSFCFTCPASTYPNRAVGGFACRPIMRR